MPVDPSEVDEQQAWDLFYEYRDKATKVFEEAEKIRVKINELAESGLHHSSDELLPDYDRLARATMLHIAMAELHRPRGN